MLDLESESTLKVLVIEGSQDGSTWLKYEPKFFTAGPSSAPKFFAPYQPRIDHQLWYEGISLFIVS